MPYIRPEIRGMLDAGSPIQNPGNLNYLISSLLNRYWTNSNRRYQDINDVLGALEGAKMEFYRKVAVPYEENKEKENGGLY